RCSALSLHDALPISLRCAALSLALVLPLEAAEHRVVGLTSSGMRIEAALVSSPSFTVPTVMLVGGLGGNDESARLVEQEVRRWEDRKSTRLNSSHDQ